MAANSHPTKQDGSLLALRQWWRIRAIKSRVWVTTGGKDHFVLVPRWRVLLAAFSRKDVRW